MKIRHTIRHAVGIASLMLLALIVHDQRTVQLLSQGQALLAGVMCLLSLMFAVAEGFLYRAPQHPRLRRDSRGRFLPRKATPTVTIRDVPLSTMLMRLR